MPRILVLGSTGQVGRALCACLGDDALGVTSQELNFLSPNFADDFQRILDANDMPELVINCAAYTNVEQAESDGETAMQVNAVAPGMVAEILYRRGAGFIHTSTDYVFSGNKNDAYHEGDKTNPLNIYGRSKLAGEQAVMQQNPNSYVLRYSWVYDGVSKNFLTAMLGLMVTQKQLRIVADQIGAPSYAGDLAVATQEFAHKILFQQQPEAGIYHMCARGHTSWHGFATAIFRAMTEYGIPRKTTAITPIVSKEFTTKATRPENSKLMLEKLHALGIRLPHWRDGLSRAMADVLAKSNEKVG